MNAVAGCELHATRRPLYHATAGSPLSITRTGDDEEGRCCHAPSYADAVLLLRRVHRRRRWKVEKPPAEPCLAAGYLTLFCRLLRLQEAFTVGSIGGVTGDAWLESMKGRDKG
nr:hypothetical protein Itr_chr11CG20540 [Ipomoea trifida]